MPNGQLQMRLPYGWHQSAWWDVTHLRPWFQESFAILQPGFTHFTRNYQHEAMGFAFWVASIVLILERRWARMWNFAPLRPLVLYAGAHLLNVYSELLVEAFKTTEDDPLSTAYGGPQHPCVVPTAIGAMLHDLKGKKNVGPFFTLLTYRSDNGRMMGKGIATVGGSVT